MGFLDRLFGSPKGTDAADQLFERVAKAVFRQLDNATQPYVGYGETRETDWFYARVAACQRKRAVWLVDTPKGLAGQTCLCRGNRMIVAHSGACSDNPQ